MGVLLQSLLTYVLVYKYAAIFLITGIAAVGFPIPAVTILVASAFFATEGYLNFAWVLVAGAMGNIAGDNVGYWLARRYGEPLLIKIGLRRVLQSQILKKLEGKVTSHPITTVFLSRFVGGLTPVVNTLAGLGKMRYLKFFVLDVAGETVDVALVCAGGFLFGSNWQSVGDVVGKFVIIIAIAVILGVTLFGRRRVKRQKRE